jgi:phosphocarrier protein HPr
VIERTVRLKNRLGLHARAAAKVVQTAAGFESKVTLAREGDEVDGKSILGLLFLAASQGAELVVRVEGTDEKDAFEALQSLIDRKFDEKE